MRKFLASFLLIVACYGVMKTSPAYSLEKPLMVIRFTENFVPYKKNLDKAVKMTLEAKSDVAFNIVAISPETGDATADKQNKKRTQFLLDRVVEQVEQAGVSKEKITSEIKSNKINSDSEIQIFVQ